MRASISIRGSPPRMRGKEGFLRPAVEEHRITPAYAGKRLGDGHGKSPPNGSPPRMRGKGGIPGSCRTRKGITPAYAGKSAPFLILVTGNRDHPRVCGEKAFRLRPKRNALGSPPRMRGKGPVSRRSPARAGITPAYAGKSSRPQFYRCGPRDHPRVCGEKPG